MTTFGIIGLGKMGAGLAAQALEKGHAVAGYSLGGAPGPLRDAGLTATESLSSLVHALRGRRFILLYIPAGTAVDQTLDALADELAPGDIVGDGGNSYWGDSIRRAARLAGKGIAFLDIGTSGGPEGARHGACFMVGGEAAAVRQVEPLLRDLAVPGGFIHAGASGAGHFVKLVHNGIEFGMLQAIGEGVALLNAYPDRLRIGDVLEAWRHGSVIRSWLVDLMTEMYRRQGGLDTVPSHVEDTGEVNWLVDDALQMEIPTPVIAQAVVQLVAARQQRHDAARAVALMRHGFGGHPFGKDAAIARERHHGRVGGFIRPGDA